MPETLAESIYKSFNNRDVTWQKNESTPSEITKVFSIPISWTETRTGSQNPKWRDSVEKLREAGTAYSRLNRMTYSVGKYKIRVDLARTRGLLNYYGESHDYSYIRLPANVVTSSKAYNTALGNFLTDINSAMSPFKGMVFLGELKETLKMLRSPASALRDGFSTFIQRARRHRRSRWSRQDIKDVNRILANSWLEYCYGWIPLMASIKDAAEAYKALQDKVYTSFVSGQSQDDFGGTTSTVFDPWPLFCYIFKTSKEAMRDKVRFKGQVVHRFSGLDTLSAQRVAELSGFRLGEFLPTVWELLPYSFILDYFTNIGQVLNAVSALAANLAWRSCSRWTSTSIEVSYRADTTRILNELGKLTTTVTESGVPSRCERLNYSRVIPDLKVPELVLHLPNNPWQWVNLLALFSARII